MLPIRPNGELLTIHVLGADAELSLEDINFSAIAEADFLHLGGAHLMPKLDS